jgi:putative hydrolase of the HAD superfamily
MIQGIIFDMDDTLVAFDIVSEKTWRKVCGEFSAREGNPELTETLYAAIRRESHLYWSDPERNRRGRLDIEAARRETVRLAFGALGRADMHNADLVADAHSERRLENMHLLPGTEETLETLLALDYNLVLLTNGDSRIQRQKIARFGLEKYFRDILIEEELGFGKPDERAFYGAMQKTGTLPEETVMVGDNYEWEMAPALRLGITAIWHNYGGMRTRPPESAAPDYTIDGITEIIGILEKIGPPPRAASKA